MRPILCIIDPHDFHLEKFKLHENFPPTRKTKEWSFMVGYEKVRAKFSSMILLARWINKDIPRESRGEIYYLYLFPRRITQKIACSRMTFRFMLSLM